MSMLASNAPYQRYTLPAVVLHWCSALLLFGLLGLGWYMADLPKGPERGWFIGVHKSLGFLAFGLLLLRTVWRWTHRPPPLPDTLPLWQRKLAGAVHVLLYLALVAQPLSGYLSASFSGYPMAVFGVPVYNWGWKEPVLNDLFSDIHEVSAVILAVLIAVHVFGALRHAATAERGLLRRMLP